MAQGQISNHINNKPKMVFCSTCRIFNRDTEGISRRKDTGEFFMGLCPKGHNDGHRKVFADKPRICSDHKD